MMIVRFVCFLMQLFFVAASDPSQLAVQQSTLPADSVRAALCDIDKHDYASAHKKLESLDQQNPAVRKLLVAVQARMFKKGDNTPDNLALIRKAISGYEHLLKDLQLSTEEKKKLDSSVLLLYAQLGEEELKKELLTRAADVNRPTSERVEAMGVLASKSWDCSYKITSNQSSKDASAIAKAKACVTDGLGYSTQAMTLDPTNESAWSYKTNLLLEASRIADLEGRPAEKIAYLKQYEQSLKRTAEVNNSESSGADSFTITEVVKARDSEDLLEFKDENSLDKVAADLLQFVDELTPLFVSQTSGSESETALASSKKSTLAQQKRDWKTFTAAEDLTLDLPDNVSPTRDGYVAGSDGVDYSVISTGRTPVQAVRVEPDRLLNVLARTYVIFLSRAWLEGGYGNMFELKFLRKEMANNQPRKVYSYSLRSCGENKDGVLLVQASKSHLYTIAISGASYSDTNVQRLIRSIKVK